MRLVVRRPGESGRPGGFNAKARRREGAARQAATKGLEPPISRISRIQNPPSMPPQNEIGTEANEGNEEEFRLRSFVPGKERRNKSYVVCLCAANSEESCKSNKVLHANPNHADSR